MRVWRRVIGDPRCGKTTMTDQQVRERLGIESIDCMVRKKRLCYFSRLARAELEPLQALLQAKTPGKQPTKWVRMIINDLERLQSALPVLLAELPPPAASLAPWWHLARAYPREWKEIVNKYTSSQDDSPVEIVSALLERNQHTAQGHTCEQCGENFETHRQLSTHMWSKHKIKSSFRQFIGNTSVCPVCHTDFCTRARLIKHLADRRVRSRHREQTCQQAFLASDPELVPPDELAELERVEAQDKKRQRRISSSAIIAAEPARPARQSALKRARVEPPARVPTRPKRPRRH